MSVHSSRIQFHLRLSLLKNKWSHQVITAKMQDHKIILNEEPNELKSTLLATIIAKTQYFFLENNASYVQSLKGRSHFERIGF